MPVPVMTSWRVQGGERIIGRDVPGFLIVTVASDDPDVLSAVEGAASRVGIELVRLGAEQAPG